MYRADTHKRDRQMRVDKEEEARYRASFIESIGTVSLRLGHAYRGVPDSLDLAEAVLFQNHANGINGGLCLYDGLTASPNKL